MKKNYLVLGMALAMGLVFTGCGQNAGSDVARIQQENVQDENTYTMEADAPKDLEAEAAQQAAEEAAIQKAAEEAARKAVEEANQQKEQAAEEAARNAAEEAAQNQTTTTDPTENLISRDEAINIVLKKVGGGTKSDVFIELDFDDGYWKYEGEVYYDLKEYEFELNAENGTIMEWSVESIYD